MNQLHKLSFQRNLLILKPLMSLLNFQFLIFTRRYLTRESIWHKSIFHKALKYGIISIDLLCFLLWESASVSLLFFLVLNKGNTGTIFNVFGMAWGSSSTYSIADWTRLFCGTYSDRCSYSTKSFRNQAIHSEPWSRQFYNTLIALVFVLVQFPRFIFTKFLKLCQSILSSLQT